MRGTTQVQPDFLTVVNLNSIVPADHPLRAIKRRVDVVLQKLSPLFDALYAQTQVSVLDNCGVFGSTPARAGGIFSPCRESCP
jgi:hypothetical protein